jgi:hypothetical protein
MKGPAHVRWRSVALSSAAWLAAGAALAQPASPPAPTADSPAPATAAPSAAKPDSTTVGEVVVQGRSPQAGKSFAAAVDKFVHAQGRSSFGHAPARWDRQLCPKTAGLKPDAGDLVSRRIKEVAARVGAPADGKCRGDNVLVVFTARPDTLMADVRDHHPELLGYHFVGQTKSLAAFSPPMKSWYVTTTDGRLDAAYAHEPACIDLLGCRILPPLHSRFAFALVVVDSSWLVGRPIGAVADAIAMTVLSQPARRDGCSSLPSIMDTLDPACSPGEAVDGLTAYDEAYLKALYAYNTGRYAAETTEFGLFEHASIAQSIIKDTGPPPRKAAGP